jgi:manganese oxidase
VRTYIGVDQTEIAKKVGQLVPGFMPMGSTGGAAMTEMRMPTPDNTLPMMTGEGPFGSVEMGGMFSVVKVRQGLARGDYKDPGWYRNPPGTVAYKVGSEVAAALPGPSTAAPPDRARTHGGADGRVMAMEVRARRRTIGMQAMDMSKLPMNGPKR